MKKVLITLPLGEKRLAAINQLISADCIPGKKNIYQETAERIADYEGLLVLGTISKVDEALLSKAKNLKIISNYGVGYDKIDTNYAKAHNIIVANTPHSVTAPTADLTLALMLGLSRRIVASDRAIRNNTSKNWYNPPLPSMSLEDKVLGIIGMGRIGKAVAQRAFAFGLKNCYFQRTPLPTEIEQRYQTCFLPLDQLLQQVDILSLHIPLNPTTHHLLGKRELELLKPTALLVNTARGGVIDEPAMIEALQTNKIAGAALDVFAEEPNIPTAFLEMENVILTPHIGTASKEARENMFKESIGNLVEYFGGNAVTNRVV